MFQYQRLFDLFNYIYNHKRVLPSTLSEVFNVSVRTIRSDIQTMNALLIENGAEVILKRNRGYEIKINDEKLFTDFIAHLDFEYIPSLYLETPEDRVKYITKVLLMANSYITLDSLTQQLFVTQTTLQSYIKNIIKLIEPYELEFINRNNQGMKIIGEEIKRRKCIIDILLDSDKNRFNSKFSPEDYFFFRDIKLDELKKAIYDIFLEYDISINDIDLKNLIIHIALMIQRIKSDNYINFFKVEEINHLHKDFFIKIVQLLENNYHIYLSDSEKNYLYVHIISNSNYDILEISNKEIYSYVEELLECIYNDYNFDLRNDTILVEDLMNHFKSILNTKFFLPDKKNPLLPTIKSNFPLPFEISFTCMTKVFNQSRFQFDEDDTGYIALHIGAAIERCFHSKLKEKKVILVCDGSHATARILEARITNYFSNKIKILGIYSCTQFDNLSKNQLEDIDFIISTTASFHYNSIPVISVDFSLKKKDIEKISKTLTHIQNKSIQEKCHFFDEDLFILNKQYNNKIDLLTDMTQLLLDKKIIEENFLDSVLERENLAKTNINNVFAFPHPMKFYANETKVVVGIFEKPLQWNKEETVQIVFLLATKSDDKSNIELLYNIIVEIINNSQFQKSLIKSTNFQEFVNTISLFYKDTTTI